MSDFKKYVFNPKTLSYEELVKPSRRSRLLRGLLWFVLSVAAAIGYFWLYTSVLGLEPPKTILLKKENAMWRSRVELLNRQMDMYDAALEDLASRDESIYRQVFGMNSIDDAVRNAGFGGVNRYLALDETDPSGRISNSVRRLDILTKKAYVQSRSFDDVASLAKRAGDMASCIPAITPMNPDKSHYRISSRFGHRSDPKSGKWTFHEGIDFAMKTGTPVYVTGDGVVESVKFEFFGYGTNVIIDHGFGYKTRYAHLSGVNVTEGMKVKRGEQIAESGNTGKSTGPHLHYEVIYKGRKINPANYYDLDFSPEEYEAMVVKHPEKGEFYVHPMHRKKRG